MSTEKFANRGPRCSRYSSLVDPFVIAMFMRGAHPPTGRVRMTMSASPTLDDLKNSSSGRRTLLLMRTMPSMS
ncbi:MAG: hypothetical protein AUH27_05550 [Chloroflexi bacterium 13_1_40CM_66_19]|nr:MAG: hypothetical protein AUH27_05550 [Chloroflexi bacterium 13_1_40CM_66_19]